MEPYRDSTPPPQDAESAWVVQECPLHGIVTASATIDGYCPVAVGGGDNCAILLGPEFEVVPRSEVEALAEALESIASQHLPPQISREIAREALAAYRARHPKETP